MNALAQNVTKLSKDYEALKNKCRQQQAEIEVLKKAQMTPYAYAVVQGKDGRENVSLQFDHPEMCGQTYRQAIPLFTHPVKELTLSDEEIANIYSDIFGYKPIDNSAVYFAKAILRKAQGK